MQRVLARPTAMSSGRFVHGIEPRRSPARTRARAYEALQGYRRYIAVRRHACLKSHLLPVYATVSLSSQSNATWAASTTDLRGQIKPASGSDRIASCWYSTTNFTFDVNMSDGLPHKVSLYCLDWDRITRVESIAISDAVTGVVLDTQTASAFGDGTFYDTLQNTQLLVRR